MAVFTFRHLNARTQRRNKGSIRAFDEAHCRELLAQQGFVEVSDISLEAEPPPTKRQMDYIRDLGVTGMRPATMHEASDLIENALTKRAPAEAPARELAGLYRVETTRFSSKATIYRRIASELAGRDDLAGLTEWYVYRVYRDACGRTAPSGIIASPKDARLAAIAAKLAREERVLSSIRREERSADGWRWFGRFTGSDGFERTGASRTTTAYRLALDALKAAGLVSATMPARSFIPPDRVTDTAAPDGQGPALGQGAARPASWWRRLLGIG